MPETPRANFDRVARLYRSAEYLCYGPLLQQVRTHWLAEIAGSRSALLLGDGDGRFLASLLARHPGVEACAVDSSAAMLRLLKARCRREAPVSLRLLHASALETALPHGCDLVVSHFFLDCLYDDQLRTLAARLAGTLAPGARWLVSDFDLPRRPILRPLARAYLRLLYAAFRMLTGLRVTRLPNIAKALHDAGFVRICRVEFAAGMLYSEVWQLQMPAAAPKPSVPDRRESPGAAAPIQCTETQR